MVKLNWLESFGIYVIVAVIIGFLMQKVGYSLSSSWVSVIIWIILYMVVSNIIIKIIQGKDIEKPQQKKKSKSRS